MKKYDNETKQWVDENELDRKLAKRKTCVGGREHDFVEVLPFGAEALNGYKGIPEPYYEMEDAVNRFINEQYEKLEREYRIKVTCRHFHAFGVVINNRVREYVCTVCKKCMRKKKIVETQEAQEERYGKENMDNHRYTLRTR